MFELSTWTTNGAFRSRPRSPCCAVKLLISKSAQRIQVESENSEHLVANELKLHTGLEQEIHEDLLYHEDNGQDHEQIADCVPESGNAYSDPDGIELEQVWQIPKFALFRSVCRYSLGEQTSQDKQIPPNCTKPSLQTH